MPLYTGLVSPSEKYFGRAVVRDAVLGVLMLDSGLGVGLVVGGEAPSRCGVRVWRRPLSVLRGILLRNCSLARDAFGSAGEGSRNLWFERGAKLLDEYSRTEVECTTTVTVTVIVVACQNPGIPYRRRLCFHGHGPK